LWKPVVATLSVRTSAAIKRKPERKVRYADRESQACFSQRRVLAGTSGARLGIELLAGFMA
jgi:hypothetical protein